MRRYQKWLSVGLLALTPGIAAAGLFDSANSRARGSTASRKAAKDPKAVNQELAEQVARAIQKARLSGYELAIDVRSGVVTLDGIVGSREQRAAFAKIASNVAGVTGVVNRLRVEDLSPKGRAQQAAATNTAGRAHLVQQADYRAAANHAGAIEQAQATSEAPPAGITAAPSAPTMMPAYAAPPGQAVHVAYNQPNLPDNSWPTYAQYPNYGAVTYPSQYSASAWPYIGPFYPYPQVPLGWRKATLEWNEGNWNLSFDSKTNRWWWFIDPKNW